MKIFEYQYTDQSELEEENIDLFNKWLCDLIYTNINTAINKRKIEIRLKYLMTAKWISWNKNAIITASDIMKTIHSAIKFTKHDKNVIIIEIDGSTTIPQSNTMLDRLIRFLEYGDINTRPTNMFGKATQEFTAQRLFYLWNVFINRQLGRGITNIEFKV